MVLGQKGRQWGNIISVVGKVLLGNLESFWGCLPRLRGRTSKSQRLCATAGTTIQQAWQKIVKGMFFQAWKENIPWKDMRKKAATWEETDFIHSFCFYSCRNAGINELQNLKYLPRSSTEREIFFEDRTPAHADHVGFGLERITTAAVGKSYPCSNCFF